MKYVSVVLPIMKDKKEQDDVRKALLDLLANLNQLDTDLCRVTTPDCPAGNSSIHVSDIYVVGTLPSSNPGGGRVWLDGLGYLRLG